MTRQLMADLKPCAHEKYDYKVWLENGTSWVEKYPNPHIEQYQCQSYFDDDNVLRDCSCGECK